MATTLRRWLLTIFPEHIEGATQQIPFDAPGRHHVTNMEIIEALTQQIPSLRYACMSAETGEKTQHEHIHIYVELSKPQRLSAFKKIFGEKHHYEGCKGEQGDNIDYVCHTGKHKNKPGELTIKPIHIGKPCRNEMSNSPYDTAVEMLFEGIPLTEICQSLGGSILSQVGNLSRLKSLIDGRDEQRGKEIENKYLYSQLQKTINELRSENTRLKAEASRYSDFLSYYNTGESYEDNSEICVN